MQRAYLDTLALIPMYRKEQATDKVMELVGPDDELIITELALIEFNSAFYKAFRKGEMSLEYANKRIEIFESERLNRSTYLT